MKKSKLTLNESVTIASMLFGMFFGAGNLIFPIYMGQLAGNHVWLALAGFLITGVGLPLLGVAALGVSRSSGLVEMSGHIGKPYSFFFTCALYLTIGPFFAIPRCATTPFSIGVTPLLGEGQGEALPLTVFTLAFFAVVLFFSLRPNGILTWIGKILNPIFLAVLSIIVVRALISPLGAVSEIVPDESYASGAFFTGFLEGYNTMDALASLAFGIVVVSVIHELGIEEPSAVASNTIRSGIYSCIIMAVIYAAVAIVGAQSRGLFPVSANGGEALSIIVLHYFGTAGSIILTVLVVFACLKTAVGLTTSCSDAFVVMFPNGPSYKTWATIFCSMSCLVANLGLSAIIVYSLPVLMLLYPLAITLILLSLFGKLCSFDPTVFRFVTSFTLAAAVFDFFHALPAGIQAALHLDSAVSAVYNILPFAKLGLGWLCPAALGLAVGLILHLMRKAKNT